jgi:predicted lysophospholipase L1 biosynthesis ABC-type transport system permease subunit
MQSYPERGSEVKPGQWFRETLGKRFSEKKARGWLLAGLLAFVALQVYFVQEMLAALILFTGVFVIFAAVALVLYLIDRAGQLGLGWAEVHAQPVAQLARRGWAAAEEISKKPFHRPRSETAP